ncbi:group III truncated hemoglobin [Aquabacter spiritensis]|uniref:Hemoglobin n=1 Tax=Aquabacter spiritensis TaxID=933073 RepID=A0A4R3M0N6_9HYPH|nr:group III truncated hemoglobin [Aquabacter spiritensis]TCT06634.1 hemoglobin [Aquabacter spiritensis]
MTAPLDPAAIRAHLDAFYDKVRRDPALGPVFAAAVEDWPHHMDTLAAFWGAVLLKSGGYAGNPLAAHKALPLAPERFAALFPVWLGLWRETAAERFPPEVAALLTERAERIARSLEAGILFDPARRPV